MFVFYDIIFALLSLFYLPYTVMRGKWHAGFPMRLGRLPASLADDPSGRPSIWFHAVSIGEVVAVSELIKQTARRCPQYRIICSTVTQTGQALARDLLKGKATVIYAPLDFSWVVRKFISVLRPRIYIAAETEIWPNLYAALKSKRIPIAQINGRISDGSLKGYKRIGFLTKRILSCVDLFYMQSRMDAERIKELGADPARVHVAGNLKFDQVFQGVTVKQEEEGFPEETQLLVAGSTHPGEEEMLIDIYGRLVGEFGDLCLVLVPRHVERADGLLKLIENLGYQPVRFSDMKGRQIDSKSIVVVDAIGQLPKLYGMASIVFVGKSFAVGGGQNMIEPAGLGKPVIVGPMTGNFKDAVRIFLEAGGLIQVQNKDELLQEIKGLLRDRKRAEGMGQRASLAVQQHQGATARALKAVTGLLNGTETP